MNKRFKEKYKFNPRLFNDFVSLLKKSASKKPRTFTSRILNLIIWHLSLNNKENRPDKNNNYNHRVSELRAEFLRKIVDVDFVSFDIFDTLLVRKVQEPADIFSLIEEEYNFEGFRNARIIAEHRARINLNKPEISLNDIYLFIPDRFKSLQEIEANTEKRLLIRNPLAMSLYKIAIERGKPIIAVSDMYLDSKLLRSILEEQGYTKISKIFVSCEEEATKFSGTIFNQVESHLSPLPQKIKFLHIGDNFKADVEKSKQAGWSAIWFPHTQLQLLSNKNKYSIYNSSLRTSIHNSLVCRYTKEGKNSIWHEYGYMLGGPLVLAYLYWVIQKAEISGNDHLAFIGRDGWVLREMYEQFLKKSNLSSSYVYMPRTISLLSTLQHNNCPRYIEYILNKAHTEGINITQEKISKNNLKTFQEHFNELINWSKSRRDELEFHLNERLKGATSPAFVDLTSVWLTALSAGHVICGDKNTNNYLLWFFGEYSKVKCGNLPFETCIGNNISRNDTRTPIKTWNKHLHEEVSIIELIEMIISSPEKRVVGLKNDLPIYGNEGAKDYYHAVTNGISEYLSSFLSDYPLDNKHVLSPNEAIDIYFNFAENLTENDQKNLTPHKIPSDIENRPQPTYSSKR